MLDPLENRFAGRRYARLRADIRRAVAPAGLDPERVREAVRSCADGRVMTDAELVLLEEVAEAYAKACGKDPFAHVRPASDWF